MHTFLLQVARLQREMEGLEEQRARAREEARKAEHARQQLEQEIKVRFYTCTLLSHLDRWRRRNAAAVQRAALSQPRQPCVRTSLHQHFNQTMLSLAAVLCGALHPHCPVSVLQELRKASGQQLREVQVVQGEAVKQLQDEQQQAKRKEAQLKVRVVMWCLRR